MHKTPSVVGVCIKPVGEKGRIFSEDLEEIGNFVETLATQDTSIQVDHTIARGVFVKGMGSLHLEVIVHRITEHFGEENLIIGPLQAVFLQPTMGLEVQVPKKFEELVHNELLNRCPTDNISVCVDDIYSTFTATFLFLKLSGLVECLRSLTNNSAKSSMCFMGHVEIDNDTLIGYLVSL